MGKKNVLLDQFLYRPLGRASGHSLHRQAGFKLAAMLLTLIFLTTLVVQPAFAGGGGLDFYVTTTGVDTGNCLSSLNPCRTITYTMTQTLSGDRIHIAAGTYTENLSPTKNLAFYGAGMNATFLDGGGLDTVIADNSSDLVFTDMTIQNGHTAGSGGGIAHWGGTLTLTRVKVTGNVAKFGAGIDSAGQLTMTDCVVSGNFANIDSSSTGGGLFIQGSGITATLVNVTISGNTATANSGGIHNQRAGTVNLTNVTISGNTANMNGAMSTTNSSTLNITNSTIVYNHFSSGGSNGGIGNYATTNFKNTIVAWNDDSNCFNGSGGSLNTLWGNLDSGNTCGFSHPSDFRNTDPLLGPLSDNGGYTQTHALLDDANPLHSRSPAIDGGTNTGCPSTDQRGVARPQDGNFNGVAVCDIGAYEYNKNVAVKIGAVAQGYYLLAPGQSTRANYAGVDSGPVVVQNSGSTKIIAALRDSWWNGSSWTSYVQMMGLPAGQLSDTYVFPAYNNVTLDEQLRFGNVGTTDTIVTVTIGGVVRGTYHLYPPGSTLGNSAERVNYAGLDSGPVVVQSSGSVPIIAAIRDSWWNGSSWTSYSQLMGLPSSQLSTSYVFPAYNNVTLDEQLRFGNIGTTDTTVTVTIGGVVRGTYHLYPPGSPLGKSAERVNYAGLDSGPVVVQSSGGVKIIAALRDSWWNGTSWTSYVQTMGLPAGQTSDTYTFPAYNNVTLDEQLRFGNVGTTDTIVTVTIGGVVRGTYHLYPPGSPLGNSAERVNYAGLDSGPVVVQSSGSVKIIAALRDSWWDGTSWTSYSQLMGLPSSQLSTSYVFPAYNNVTLDEQLRIGVP